MPTAPEGERPHGGVGIPGQRKHLVIGALIHNFHLSDNRPSFLSGELPRVALGLGAAPLLGARAHILF